MSKNINHTTLQFLRETEIAINNAQSVLVLEPKITTVPCGYRFDVEIRWADDERRMGRALGFTATETAWFKRPLSTEGV